jgi:hypothetical protein
MTHAVRPVVREIHEQDQCDPVPPGAVVRREEGKFFEEKLVHPDAKYLQEQTGKLRRYAATDIGNRIRQTVKFLVSKPFNQQFYPDKDEKNGNGKNDRVYVQDVFLLFAPNLIT